jgi:hypothetical protein
MLTGRGSQNAKEVECSIDPFVLEDNRRAKFPDSIWSLTQGLTNAATYNPQFTIYGSYTYVYHVGSSLLAVHSMLP